MIRFSPDNWKRFETHNKKTTIRFFRVKPGVHVAGTGSPQYGNWKPYLEKMYVHPETKSCPVKELTLLDAFDDGFDSLAELMFELGKRNPKRSVEETVYKHPVEKIKTISRVEE